MGIKIFKYTYGVSSPSSGTTVLSVMFLLQAFTEF